MPPASTPPAASSTPPLAVHEDSERTYDRELSWLQFNARVLQEAEDPTTPLFDRLFFLAVWSSNLDEFFRVRVASLRAASRHEPSEQAIRLPTRLLRAIYARVTEQQERFGRILRGAVLPALEREGIALLAERHLSQTQLAQARAHFEAAVRPLLTPVVLTDAGGGAAGENGAAPFLVNNRLYLVAELWPDVGGGPAYGFVHVPSPPLDRFVVLPSDDAADSPLARLPHPVLFLDDVVRVGLPACFPGYEVGASYAVKLSRDAELILGDPDDEVEAAFKQQIEAALARRDEGVPSRFLYDAQTPFALLAFLKDRFALTDEDLVPGGRTHNLSDLADFPRFGRDDLRFVPPPPLAHPTLADAPSVLASVRARDRLVHPPYQSFRPVVRFLEEAAADPAVTDLWITLYRAADDSAVVRVLQQAAERGKRVHACIEIMARFDEAPNLRWAAALEAAGATVHYSYPGLKVHAKLMLVARQEADAPEGMRLYAYLGTGNLNEKTARVYADHGLLTADARLTADVRKVFGLLMQEDGAEAPTYDHLLVAPVTLRRGFEALVDYEIAEAEAGRRGHMVLKMNALEDRAMVERLYAASQAGVEVELICRGLCTARPGVPGLSENLQARSILGRYLEHARVYDFHHGGARRLYLASADWMHRNLSRRIEVAFPVYDAALQAELRALLDLQRRDTVKARALDAEQRNRYVEAGDAPPLDAQVETFRLLADQVSTER